MGERVLHYHGSPNPVRVGDRILVRGWFGRARLAVVIFIPGQGEPDRDLGNDQWAYRLDDGSVYAAGHFPSRFPEASKRITFVCRAGEEAQEVIRAYRLPLADTEEKGRPGRDLLALIGLGTLIALVICVVIWRVLVRRG